MSVGSFDRMFSFFLYLIAGALLWQSCTKVHFLDFRQSPEAAVSLEERASGIEEAAMAFNPCVCGWVDP